MVGLPEDRDAVLHEVSLKNLCAVLCVSERLYTGLSYKRALSGWGNRKLHRVIKTQALPFQTRQACRVLCCGFAVSDAASFMTFVFFQFWGECIPRFGYLMGNF